MQWALGLSTSVPTIEFSPENIFFIDDSMKCDTKKMLRVDFHRPVCPVQQINARISQPGAETAMNHVKLTNNSNIELETTL